MSYSSVVEILKVNELREGTSTKTGKKWVMQEAECILRDGDGGVAQVGGLDIPREMIGQLVPGLYMATFSLQAHYQTRKIGAVLVDLRPMPKAAPSSGVRAEKAA